MTLEEQALVVGAGLVMVPLCLRVWTAGPRGVPGHQLPRWFSPALATLAISFVVSSVALMGHAWWTAPTLHVSPGPPVPEPAAWVTATRWFAKGAGVGLVVLGAGSEWGRLLDLFPRVPDTRR